jgi:hypothetical protein
MEVGTEIKPTVYLDATIPSFYYEGRPGTILQAWREILAAYYVAERVMPAYVTPQQLLEESP